MDDAESDDGPSEQESGPTPDDEVQRAREAVIEALERSAAVYGLNRSYGRLWGVLFFADEPRSLDELVEASGYAKSTVSTAMQRMERLHLVHRRSVPGGGKRAYYEAETDFWAIIRAFLEREVRREIDIMTRALATAGETLEAADDPAAEADLEKVRDLERTYRRSEQLVDLLTSSSIDRLAGLLEQLRGD